MAASSYFGRLAARLMTAADLLTPPHQPAFRRGPSVSKPETLTPEDSSSHSPFPVTEPPQEGQRSEPPDPSPALTGNLEPRFGSTQVAPHGRPPQLTDGSDGIRPAVSKFSTAQGSFALPQPRLTPAGLRNRDADRAPSSPLVATAPAHLEPATGNQPDVAGGRQLQAAGGKEAGTSPGVRRRPELALAPIRAESPKTPLRSDTSPVASDHTGPAPNIDLEPRPFHRGGSVGSESPAETHRRPPTPANEERIVSTSLVGSRLRAQPMVANRPQETKPIVQIGSIEVVVAAPPRPIPSIPAPTPQLPASHPLSHGFSWSIGLRQS